MQPGFLCQVQGDTRVTVHRRGHCVHYPECSVLSACRRKCKPWAHLEAGALQDVRLTQAHLPLLQFNGATVSKVSGSQFVNDLPRDRLAEVKIPVNVQQIHLGDGVEEAY